MCPWSMLLATRSVYQGGKGHRGGLTECRPDGAVDRRFVDSVAPILPSADVAHRRLVASWTEVASRRGGTSSRTPP